MGKMVTAMCKQCGKEFTYESKGQPEKYCSKDCRKKVKAAQRKEHNKGKKPAFATKKCAFCKKEFTYIIKSGGQRYCSEACKEAGHAVNDRKSYHKAQQKKVTTRPVLIVKVCAGCGEDFTIPIQAGRPRKF